MFYLSNRFNKMTASVLVAALVFVQAALTPLEAKNATDSFWKERSQAYQKVEDQNKKLALLAQANLESFSGSSGALAQKLITQGWMPQSLKSFPASEPVPNWVRQIPFQQVALQSAWFPKNWKQDDPVFVAIQDAHRMVSAQSGIAQALAAIRAGLESEAAQPLLVGLEGASGPLNLEPYRSYPDPEVVRKSADFLLNKKLLTGSEYAGVMAEEGAHPFYFWGMETPRLYQAHVDAFRAADVLAQESTDRLALWQTMLSAKKQKLNPNLRAWVQLTENLQTGVATLSDVIADTHLDKTVLSRFPELERFGALLKKEKSIQFKLAERERTEAIRQLVEVLPSEELKQLSDKILAARLGLYPQSEFYRDLETILKQRGLSLARYPNLRAYISYAALSDEIDAFHLLTELPQLLWQNAAALAQDSFEQQMVALLRDMDLAQKLLHFRLTPEEWRAYQTHQKAIAQIEERLGISEQIAAIGNVPQKKIGSAAPLPLFLKPFENFNQLSFARNDALLNHLIAKSQEQTFAQPIILVAGGFHTEGIVADLKARNQAVLVLTPHLNEATTDGTAYLDILRGKAQPIEKILARPAVTLAPQLVSVKKPIAGIAQEERTLAQQALLALNASLGDDTQFQIWLQNQVPNFDTLVQVERQKDQLVFSDEKGQRTVIAIGANGAQSFALDVKGEEIYLAVQKTQEAKVRTAGLWAFWGDTLDTQKGKKAATAFESVFYVALLFGFFAVAAAWSMPSWAEVLYEAAIALIVVPGIFIGMHKGGVVVEFNEDGARIERLNWQHFKQLYWLSFQMSFMFFLSVFLLHAVDWSGGQSFSLRDLFRYHWQLGLFATFPMVKTHFTHNAGVPGFYDSKKEAEPTTLLYWPKTWRDNKVGIFFITFIEAILFVTIYDQLSLFTRIIFGELVWGEPSPLEVAIFLTSTLLIVTTMARIYAGMETAYKDEGGSRSYYGSVWNWGRLLVIASWLILHVLYFYGHINPDQLILATEILTPTLIVLASPKEAIARLFASLSRFWNYLTASSWSELGADSLSQIKRSAILFVLGGWSLAYLILTTLLPADFLEYWGWIHVMGYLSAGIYLYRYGSSSMSRLMGLSMTLLAMVFLSNLIPFLGAIATETMPGETIGTTFLGMVLAANFSRNFIDLHHKVPLQKRYSELEEPLLDKNPVELSPLSQQFNQLVARALQSSAVESAIEISKVVPVDVSEVNLQLINEVQRLLENKNIQVVPFVPNGKDVSRLWSVMVPFKNLKVFEYQSEDNSEWINIDRLSEQVLRGINQASGTPITILAAHQRFIGNWNANNISILLFLGKNGKDLVWVNKTLDGTLRAQHILSTQQ